MSDKNNPANCTNGSIALFKLAPGTAAGHIDNSEANYPNPITSSTDFKTVVPFSVTTGGEAKITFQDASGKVIHSETQHFEGGGKHFFYFSGATLPTGTYYYTIEYPAGNPIVKRSLIIVK